MEPITRSELYLAAAAGEYDGDLPDPQARAEYYFYQIAERVNEIGTPGTMGEFKTYVMGE